METCSEVIDLRLPFKSERVRGFQPPWRTVYLYRCGYCGAVHRVRANYRGKTPVPGIGGIICGRTLAR